MLGLELYENQVAVHDAEIASFQSEEDFLIPPSLDYASIRGMSDETRDILIQSKPASIVSIRLCLEKRTDLDADFGWLLLRVRPQGAAKRLEGMTPAAILLVMSAVLQEKAASALAPAGGLNAPVARRSAPGAGVLPKPPPFAVFRPVAVGSSPVVQQAARSICGRRYSSKLATSARDRRPSVEHGQSAAPASGSGPQVPKDLRNYWRSKYSSNYPRNWLRTPPAERQLDQCPSSDSAQIRKTLLEIIRFTVSGERNWLSDFIAERLPLLEIQPQLVQPLFKRFLGSVERELAHDSYLGSWEDVWNIRSLQADYSGYTDDARGGSWLCAEKLCIIHRLLGWAEVELVGHREGWRKTSPVLYPTIDRLARLAEATDVRQYVNRFPAARAVKRKIKLHVGPTNSGKTYNALIALVNARSGFYAGPLRLLAHEVWSRINRGTMAGMGDVGRECNLLTGEEVRVVDEESRLASCTVEMIGLNTAPVDVAVVDEIQLLGDPNRGGVWNSTVLGACAHELHLCGEDTVVDLVKRIAAETGDEVEVTHHTRLAPLAVAEDSLDGNWSKIRKGDCVIAFGRKTVHAIKDEIQAQTPLKCVVAYGGLPPETRAEQAKLFNDPDSGFDVLVATDAVGMGLNLYVR